MDLTKKTVRNSVYSFVAFAWPVLLSFFVTPFVVRALGAESYGILALVTSFVGFLAFVDFGISPSLVKYTAEYYAQKKYQLLSRLFSTALFFYLIIGLVAAVAISLFAHFWASDFFKVSAGNSATIRVVFYIAAFGFLANMILSAFSAIPGSLQRFDITSKINLLVSTVASALTVALIMMGFGVAALVLLGACISFIAIFVYARVNKRLIPQLKLVPTFDKETTKKIFVFGGYATISTLAGTILLELDKIILGYSLGTAAVAFYVLPGGLAIKVQRSIAAITTVIFPLSSELFATGQLDKLQRLYWRAVRLTLTLIVLGVTPMYVLSYPFLLHWVGLEFAQKSSLVMQLLLATYSILAMTTIPSYIAFGAGKPRPVAIFSVVSGMLNVLLVILLIPSFGVNGAAFAFLLSVLPSFIFIHFVERSILKIRGLHFYLKTLYKLAILAAIELALAYLLRGHIVGLKEFVLVYLLIVGVSAVSFLLLGLSDKQDRELLVLIKRRIKP
ncbi:flippase [Candidatus Parcubacteria bacterium]|nr:flippase [Candidatus Parcubacteria bacterium]